MVNKVKLLELADKNLINVSKGKNLPKEYKDKGDYPVIAAGKSIPYFSSHTNYNTDTITISSSGANAGFIWKHTYPIWASDCTVIQVNKNIDLEYLYLFLLSKQELIYSFQTGAGQPHVYWKDIKNIEINLPSIEDQKQIAQTLDKAQELIDLRKESISKLDNLAKSIFIDMFADPVTNPKKWEVKKLDEVCIKITDGTHHSPPMSEFGYKYITAKHIKENKIIFEKNETYISEEEHKKIFSRCNPEIGDILYIKDGATTGIACINTLDEEFSLLSSVALLKPSKRIKAEYVVSYLNNISVKNSILLNIAGGAIKRLTIKKIKDINILIPPIELQNKFASFVEKIEEQKSLYAKELEKLEENFQALLQQSFKE